MASIYYTYGAGPEDVVTDKSGNVQDDIELTIWTAPSGTQITALLDLDGSTIGSSINTDEEGRYRFRLNSITYPTLWARDPDGDFWQIVADQVYDDVPEALKIAEQVALAIQGAPQNAFEIGMVPESADAAVNNTDKLAAAFKAGSVYIPCGTWWLSDTIRIPDRRELVGGGIGCTKLIIADGADRNAPVVTNAGNTLTAHTEPTRYIRIADLSIDANIGNRAEGEMLNEAGSGIQLACVEYAIIERVYATNGVHSFDIAASMYADTDPVTYPSGPSKWVVVRDCIGGSSGDDAFTCHGSQYLYFQNCVAWNEEGIPRNSYSNGIEVDDASMDVNITDFYAYKFHAGVQIKAHPTLPPARRVNVINAVADSCEYGFDIWWNNLNTTDPATLPDYAIAADVTLRNCRVVNLQPLQTTGTYLPALRIRSYSHVHVEDFLIQDSPYSNVILEYGCQNIDIDGLIAENSWSIPNGNAGLVNISSSAGENIRINNVQVRGKKTIDMPVVRVGSPTIRMLSISRIHGNGTTGRAAVELLSWVDTWRVEDVKGIGHKADIEITAGNRIGTYSIKIDNWLPGGVRKAADLSATYPPKESWLPLTADQATAGGWPGAGIVHTLKAADGSLFQYFYLNNTAAPRILYRAGSATAWGAWQQITITAAS